MMSSQGYIDTLSGPLKEVCWATPRYASATAACLCNVPSMRALLLVASVAAAGCFNPSLRECAVTCSAAEPCPSGASCLTDGFCHVRATDSLCSVIEPDAGPPIDASGACGNGVLQADLNEECDDSNGADSDGCSSACLTESGFVCVGQPSVCRPTPSNAGDIVFTELLLNPAATADNAGEWFEIFNPTSTEFDLQGAIIRDDLNADQESFTVTTSLVMPAQGHLVFGVSDNLATNGGAPVDFAYSTGAQLGNSADGIEIVFNDVVIDHVDWPLAPTVGASISLSAATYDAVGNDTFANFCDGVGVFGTGDLGTPGEQNPNCI